MIEGGEHERCGSDVMRALTGLSQTGQVFRGRNVVVDLYSDHFSDIIPKP